MPTPRGIDWDSETRLGVVSDEELAKLLGVYPSTVRSARRRRGIAKAVVGHDWTREEDLGVLTDAEVAEKTSRNRATVTAARLRLGIAPPPRFQSNETLTARLHEHLLSLPEGQRIIARKLAAKLGAAPTTVIAYLRSRPRIKELVRRVGYGPLTYWVRVAMRKR